MEMFLIKWKERELNHIIPIATRRSFRERSCFFIFGLLLLLQSGEVSAAKAHVHGAGEIIVAVEGKSLTVVLESPAQSIYGFETEKPRNIDERKEHRKAIRLLKGDLSAVFKLDEALGCTLENTKLEVLVEKFEEKHDGHSHGMAEHRSIQAEWRGNCEKSPAGATLRLDFRRNLPRLKRLKVTVLRKNGQDAKTFKYGHGEISL